MFGKKNDEHLADLHALAPLRAVELSALHLDKFVAYVMLVVGCNPEN
jgi:hypothetical protein